MGDTLIPHALEDLHSLADEVSVSFRPLDTNGAVPKQSLAQSLVEMAQYTVQHGLPFKPDQIPAYLDLLMHKDSIDDRKYLLEDLLSAMARLPPGNRVGALLQEQVISILYNDLPHPPDDYVAEDDSVLPPPDGFDVLHRSADGSRYTRALPTLGMARTPYARSVPPKTILELPPPERVYDLLLKRDKFVKHPSGISSLFFAFANIIIHCIFNTDQSPGYQRNNVSSYLDLSPLYGSSKEEQDSIRRGDGTGKLYDDCFADARLLFMPPSTSAMLILFNRNHNYIADQILSINEDGSYSNPPPQDSGKRAYQEEKIFQTARLVNCGFFMQIILGDYVAAILGLVRDGISWRLDPRIDVHKADGTLSQTGLGNACSIEFNLLYRWHATVSEQDTAWIEEELKGILKGRDPSTVSLEEYKSLLRTIRPSGRPQTWEFGGLKRGTEGQFADADLAKVLLDATEAYSSAYKARGTPEALRFVELLSIEQARKWGTCSLNEFRKFIKLKPYATFEEWNPDPEIAKAAQELYGTIDKLELHAGLQAEEAKHVAPGAGLCPGYTISRTILADAVALVRGDPFMTIYNTPKNLTRWGYQYTQTDPNDGSYGGLLTRMLYQHLPEYYPRGSSYAHFPFIVPEAMKGYISSWSGDIVDQYTFERPSPPAGPTVVVRSSKDVQRVLADEAAFDDGVESRLNLLTRDVGLNRTQIKATLYQPHMIAVAVDSLTRTVRQLIQEKSETGSGASLTIDIVKDVINVLPVHWICTDIAGIGLKTPENIRGYVLDQDAYDAYVTASTYTFFNNSPGEDWALHARGGLLADKVIDNIKRQLDGELDPESSLNPVRFVQSLIHHVTAVNDNNDEVIYLLAQELKREGADGRRARTSLAASVFTEYIPTAPIFSSAIASVVNFYLEDSNATLRKQIIELGAASALMPYISEALRLDPPISVVRATAKKEVVVDGVSVVPKQTILASLIDAARDPIVFPEPTQVNISRPFDHVHAFGPDQRGLIAREYFEAVAPVIVHEVLKLSHLRRSSGLSGEFSRFSRTTHGVSENLYLTDVSTITSFPASLHVDFDKAMKP